MERAALDRFDRVVQRIVRGDDDDLCIREIGLDLVEHLQAVGVRQLQVEQHNIGRAVLQDFESLRSRARGFDVVAVALQERFEREQNRPFIVDDQDPSLLRCHG